MKHLKFSEPLPSLILKGLKNTTFRVSDEKSIVPGDTLSLQRLDGTEFAQAKVTDVKVKDFKSLTREDMEGHEAIPSSQMLRTYSGYYHMKIMPETRLKIIRFSLLGR